MSSTRGEEEIHPWCPLRPLHGTWSVEVEFLYRRVHGDGDRGGLHVSDLSPGNNLFNHPCSRRKTQSPISRSPVTPQECET